jgi:AP-2 complex subunit mu-1
MISAVFLINQKGEIIIYRLYRDDVALSAANLFRVQVIAAKEAGTGAPVKQIEGSTFMYIRHKDMFFVAVSRTNANACKLHSPLHSLHSSPRSAVPLPTCSKRLCFFVCDGGYF